MPLSKPDRRALTVAAVAVLLYVVFQFAVFPVWDRWQQQRANLALEERTLAKYREAVQSVGVQSAATTTLEARLRETEAGLLSSQTAPLASAELQEWVKQLTAKQSIEMRSSEFLPVKPLGSAYVQVPLGFQFQGRLDQLVNLLEDIKNNERLLTVSRLSVQAGDPKQKSLNVSMVIAGIMRASPATGPGDRQSPQRERADKK